MTVPILVIRKRVNLVDLCVSILLFVLNENGFAQTTL